MPAYLFSEMGASVVVRSEVTDNASEVVKGFWVKTPLGFQKVAWCSLVRAQHTRA